MRIEPSSESPILALVVPCFNEAEGLTETISRLTGVLNELIDKKLISSQSFLYFVDDGSSDATWSLISLASCTNAKICGVRLSRNFGHQNAILAGVSSVSGRCDVSITIDADLQQDPSAIGAFIAEYSKGADIVFGVRKDRVRDSMMKKTTASIFYRLMVLFGVRIIPNHADYRLLNSKAMKALLQYPEYNLFLRAITVELGFKQAIVQFDVVDRAAGQSKYTWHKMLALAINGITSFSVAPLRLIAVLGAVIFSISTAMGCYVLYTALFSQDAVPGWASTVLPIYFIGGVQILCLGVIGEYIAQILLTTKNRPRFIIDEELP
jgi:glycosyltransferase involved in cell wall biosynthesis